MDQLPKIIDNKRISLKEALDRLIPNYKHLSIATGYIDLPGIAQLIDGLGNYESIRILIGREPLIPRHALHVPEPDFPDNDIASDLVYLMNNLDKLPPNSKLHQLQETVVKIKKMIGEGRLQIRVYKQTFLHAKTYIFGDYESDSAVGIIGSSNFTYQGLLGNAELNALESDHRIVTFQPKSKTQEVGHLFWFDQFWEEGTVWDEAFTEIISQSPVGDTLFSPYEVYIRTLYELYREELEDLQLAETEKGTDELLDFQKKNAQALMRRLGKYGVAMLSDSVGLGKTYTAIEVMKQYLNSDEGKKRVEVIAPKSLNEQWRKEMMKQRVYNLTPIVLQNSGAIEKAIELDHIASVSLFVIDESHNLRKSTGKRYEQMIDWIRNNPKADVLLLTATPVNNQLSDIMSQILLGTRGRSDLFTFAAPDAKTKQTTPIDFVTAITNLQKKLNQDIKRGNLIDYGYIRQVMAPIIRAFVVRRTRQGIQKEYGSLLINGEEKCFPKAIPENAAYDFPPELAQRVRSITNEEIPLDDIFAVDPEAFIGQAKSLKHPLDQLSDVKQTLTEEELAEESPIFFVYQLILMLGFIPYRWRMYQSKYYGKTHEQIRALKLDSEESRALQQQVGMYGMFRTMYLKRLESSFRAIEISIFNYLDKLDIFEEGVEKGKIVSFDDLTKLMIVFESEESEEADPPLLSAEDMEAVFQDDITSTKYEVEALKRDIKKERQICHALIGQIEILRKHDPKLTRFIALLKDIDARKPAGEKVLIFSYFADTVEYLRETLPEKCELITDTNTAFLSSKNRVGADTIASRFSPRSKDYQLRDPSEELRYLVSTDVLSEGQNLQDCGVIVNYDLHWNPVRMIQRNGRINRLGSTYDSVYVYNMTPESKLENYLRLVDRLEGKIDLIKNTIGTDQSVLTELPNPIEYADALDDIYSADQQKRMEALEILESSTDFLLSEDEFVSDLKAFHNHPELGEEYKSEVYRIPEGKWSVMPHKTSRGENPPDVLGFGKLMADDKVVAHQFVRMSETGSDFQAVTNLQALEWLRTTVDDNSRGLDRISMNREKIMEVLKRNLFVYADGDDVQAPIGQQAELLNLMYGLHYSNEDIGCVRLSFQTKDVLSRRKINILQRVILKSRKEQKPYLDNLNELIKLAHKADVDVKPTTKADRVEPILYYAKDNK